MVVPLPDDFVHAGVGEERLIKFIVAPLPVAQQVHYHIPAELALVLDCQPRGTDNFFRIIPVYVDNCTSNDFTCPGMQNIVTAITPNPFQSNGNRYNVCVEHLTKKKPTKHAFCDDRWDKESSQKVQLAQPVVFVPVSTQTLYQH